MELSLEEVKIEFEQQDQIESERIEPGDAQAKPGRSEVLDAQIRDEVKDDSVQEQISDSEIDVTSLVLPEGLCILETNSEDGKKTKGVWSSAFIRKGLVFGPYADTESIFSSGVAQSDRIWTSLISRSCTAEYNVELWSAGGLLYMDTVSDIKPFVELKLKASVKAEQNALLFDHNYCKTLKVTIDQSGPFSDHDYCRKDISSRHRIRIVEQQRDMIPRTSRNNNDRMSSAHSAGMKVYKLTHTQEKLYLCTECGQSYYSLGLIKKHILTHRGKKQFVCYECGSEFSSSHQLKAHQINHTGERPHKCPMCGKGFTQAGHMQRHMLSHTEKKPFVCPHCAKGFLFASNYKTHMLIHSGEKPHKCQDCGRGFTQIHHLKHHRFTHTGKKAHKCQECGKAYYLATQLRDHKLIHTGYTPYKCQECGKCFSQYIHLKNHKNIHAGLKPYKCQDCDIAFRQPAHLKRHLLTLRHKKHHK